MCIRDRVEKSGITDALDHLMQDSYEIMDRMLLSGSVIRDGKELLKAHALNDIVVNRCGHLMVLNYEAVSYTHLDVYKRQAGSCPNCR